MSKMKETEFLSKIIRHENEYSGVLSKLRVFAETDEKYRADPILVTGLPSGAEAAFMLGMSEDALGDKGGCSIICVAEEKRAYALQRLLSSMTDKSVYVFNKRDYVFHNISASSRDTEHERIEALRACSKNEAAFVICVPESLLELLPSKERILSEIKLKVGGEYDTVELSKKLTELGYTRADTVEGAGQFAVRGDIFDIFAPGAAHPVRLEFFGDEVDCAGIFDVLTQRRISNVSEVVITPAKEIVVYPEEISAVEAEINRLINANLKRKTAAEKNRDGLIVMQIEDSVRRLEGELVSLKNGTLDCFDKYSYCIKGENGTLFDYAKGCLFILDYTAVRVRFENYLRLLSETVTDLADHGEINAKAVRYTEDLEFMLAKMRERPTVVFSLFMQSATLKYSGVYSFKAKSAPSFTRDMDILCDDIVDFRDRSYRIAVITGSAHSAGVLSGALSSRGISSVVIAPEELSEEKIVSSSVIVTGRSDEAPVFEGFELTTSKFVLFTEGQGLGAVAKKGKKKSSDSKSGARKILSYNDLSVGDYVVHESHGIGRYDGISTITTADGVKKDYITLTYSGGGQLHVPADSLDSVSRYASAGEAVKLSKIGGGDWIKTKQRVKKAAHDMAKELIRLYAERKRLPGFAFDSDGEWQRDFEAKFEYEETAGQISAINEIKRDMEEGCPMDRLLCGDVGFGKTEVAFRAAFKCIAQGKQVAILVPTTILALQHYQTALERFADFPANIEMISRFKSNTDIKKTVKRISTGEVDIVIGTHRLLSKDIAFKDLGLLIIDEEQRFGVAHKEKLKQLSANVDVLTLTATPIPRTLNMAMAGIRDMSVLEEAPSDRHPVQTYVMEHDYEVIGEAVKRELRRGGQVFYLKNRVEGIDATASNIRRLVPDAIVEVAHGQMTEDVLSDIWKRLVDGEIDVLVCTTIIETGVDVPNANTLIIENSDKLGLSQLHQIRGRVGRSGRRAYAYLTYDGTKALNEIARKRLQAIREFTEFGSGFKIAMRDLEIRGAGNLLGAEQSGHLASVGYDLFIRLLEEAVLEEKGIMKKAKCDCSVDLGISAYIPERYISLPGARIEAYKKIAAIKDKADADEVMDELLDRYGEMPAETENLIKISGIRARGEKSGVVRIEKRGGRLNIYPQSVDRDKIREMSACFKKDMLFQSTPPCFSIKLGSDKELYGLIEKIFNIYSPIEE